MTATLEAGSGTSSSGGPEVGVSRRVPLLRVRMADLAVAGAVAGVLALTGLPDVARGIALLAFIAIGPGAAVLSWVPVPRRALLSTVPVLGAAITTLVAMTAMWSYRWNPPEILWTQIIAVCVSSGYWYYRNPDRAGSGVRWRTVPNPTADHRSVVRKHLSLVLSAAAVLVWVIAVPGLPGVDASYYGLLFSGTGPLLAVCIVLCASALLVAVRDRRLIPAAVAVAAAIIVSRVTTFVATEVPLYDWTYKHLAVVDYILVHGRIAPDGTDIYAQWSAFFVMFAWFSDVTGVQPIMIAHVFAPIVHVLIALAVYCAARVMGQSRRTALTAAFLAEVVNWVGQDYFSPQAWSLVLAFGMIVLLLASPRSGPAGVLAIVVFAAAVPTHQLTPFWAVAVVCLLCLVRRARPWWISVVMVAIVGGYLLLNLEAVLPYGVFSGSSPVSNATSNIVSSGMPAKDFTSIVVRSLSLVVVVTAFGCALWRWRRKKPVVALGIVAFSSFGLLLGQNYGGEAIFRVYLYAILGCAILIAPAVVGAVDRRRAGMRGASSRLIAVLCLSGLSLAGLHGYVALWPMVVETRAQIDLMNSITEGADPRTRLVMIRPSGMPTRVNADYAELTLFNPYFDESIAYDLWDGRDPRLPELKANFPADDDIATLDDNATREAYMAYLMFSEQSNKAVRYYGDYRPEAIELLQDALRASPNWTVFYENGATLVFRSINQEKASD
ncbi:hypothetical protein [Arthrobacter sp. SLBN-53]|uniref:hypothetical protein n=1 Tax=Arthrobacter sp. SLBN-53 TaxID=2768412 RepID=UPI00116EC711|nr:hypothetical protein [Arthrobacter sp. SLBN-53]TQK31913.1 hypothetical protein FBY28_4958 [Arthrobacter sp. SLBN-53]